MAAIHTHPLGVRPSGNRLTIAVRDVRAHMGSFSRVPDEVLHLVLEWLDMSTLLKVGSTCKALFAFASNEELWRSIFIR